MMKKFIISLLITATFSCGQKRKSETKVPDLDNSQISCFDTETINEILVSIVSEKKHCKPFMVRLNENGIDSIKVASNIPFEPRIITIQGREIKFIDDSKKQLPRIILAFGKSCSIGKFEFGMRRHAISGTVRKGNEIWLAQVSEAIEIN